MFYNGKRRPTVEWLSTLDGEAAARRAAGLRRELLPRDPGDPVVDLAGNDYLGLSRHPEVLAAAGQALLDFGLGATGSRLVRGSTAAHRDLEDALAALLGFESALVYSSGYLANLGAVRALVRPGALVVSDAHNHASLIDGCRLARQETVVAPHQDPDFVRHELARHPGRPAVVVTESIFSVDGDLAPLAELYEATRAHGALLLVDDAHALGVIGPSGAGGVAAAGLSGAPGVVVTATLSKSLGAGGGVVAGPRQLYRELLDTGRTFIFDTALPPAVAAGARAALRLLISGDDRRAELRDRARRAVDRLRAEGLEVSEPAGGVISVAAPSPDEAHAWAAACRGRGVAVGCFRPPSTPDGRSRLRLTVGVGVPAADFDRAVDIILKERP
ncbi:8-amino-7-oxononanoate synthase [Dactylosporangium sp. CA-139066]|uniref:8-amino-7-oxononanoate synthase n=1 Tax=Dactylosporangium sp. CA-139066 TaxID=3239930 RepID=UPI003D8B893E